MDIRDKLDAAAKHTWDNYQEIDAIGEYCEQFFDYLRQHHDLDYIMIVSDEEHREIMQIAKDETEGKPVTAIEGYDIHLQAIKREMGEPRFRFVLNDFHTSHYAPEDPDYLHAYEIPRKKLEVLRFPGLAEAFDHLFDLGPKLVNET